MSGTLIEPSSKRQGSENSSRLPGPFSITDPVGLKGGDTNVYRYCGNSPTNATDPSGLADIQRRQTIPTEGLDINPALRQTIGTRWDWVWNNGDARFIVQQVTDSGTFSVWIRDPTTGKEYQSSVSWRETYVEAWANNAGSDENHLAGPRQAVNYLQEKTGWRFFARGDKLYIKDKNGVEWEVVRWTFEMTARFRARNGSYNNWNPPAPANGKNTHVWTTNVDFAVTGLVIDEEETKVTPGTTFTRMLYPGVRQPLLPNFPPDVTTRNLEVVCTDTWSITWTAGQKHPTANYTTSGYHVASGQ